MKTKRQVAIERLSLEDREYFEERAAIREYDGAMDRGDAERLALIEAKLRPGPFAKVSSGPR